MLLTEKQEFDGRFWLPTRPDRPPLKGTLNLSTNGRAKLKLVVPADYMFSDEVKQGNQADFLGVPSGQGQPFRVDAWVVGTLANHRYVALKTCHDRSGYWMYLPTGRDPVMHMAVQDHVLLANRDIRRTPESVTARRVTVRIDGLREWFGGAPITTDAHPVRERSPQEVTYSLPQDALNLRLSLDGCDCDLSMNHVWLSPYWSADKVSLEQDAIVTLVCDRPQPMEWWKTIAVQLANLLTFTERRPCRVCDLRGYSLTVDGVSCSESEYAEVLFPDFFPEADAGARHTGLFSARDTNGERLSEVMQGWFDLCSRDSATKSVQLLYVLGAAAGGLLDTHCAYVTTALGKMAGRGSKVVWKVSAYEEIQAAVDAVELSQEARCLLDRFGRSGMLRESRTEELLRLMRESRLDTLISGEQCRDLARRVSRLRQQVVYAESGADLSVYWPALALLEVTILARIGFTRDELAEIVSRNPHRLGRPLDIERPNSG